jgi:hypothetical protein
MLATAGLRCQGLGVSSKTFPGTLSVRDLECKVFHLLTMMMMFIGTETLVTQLVHEISRMQAC